MANLDPYTRVFILAWLTSPGLVGIRKRLGGLVADWWVFEPRTGGNWQLTQFKPSEKLCYFQFSSPAAH